MDTDIRSKVPDERLRVRREKSKPLLVEFETTIRPKTHDAVDEVSARQGGQRLANHVAALTFYCEDGRAELSDVLVENPLRCVALGRKDYLFVGSDGGGVRAAAMYSLMGPASPTGSTRVPASNTS
ncbi:IS66 family transposase [Paraburkholderia sp. RL17-373-BIF-A]|uniref:IS66 family transposase n=1 Tax=Paraburkholderia sp. RL17-373-BIF-A TaxID=3031629 RepID=UPI0038BE121B